MTLAICLICLSIVIALSIPHVVVYIFNHMQENLDVHPVAKYYVWGTVIVAFKLYILIFAGDIYTIIVRGFFEASKVGDVRTNYIIGIVALVFFQIMGFISTLSLTCTTRIRFWNNFPPLPVLIDGIVCFCHCNKKIALIAGIYVFTVCLNLVATHMIYILLAIVASPIASTSLLLLFGTATFVVIAVWAFILETVDQTKRRDWYKLVFCVFVCFVFLGFVASFIAFIIKVNIQVEHYHRDSILATLITTLVPSSVLGFIGYLGRRMLIIMDSAEREGARNNDQADGHPMQPQPNLPATAQQHQPMAPCAQQDQPDQLVGQQQGQPDQPVGQQQGQLDQPVHVGLQPNQRPDQPVEHVVVFVNKSFEELRDGGSTSDLPNYGSMNPVHRQSQLSPV